MGWAPNGAFSALFTNTITTGYFQDRLNPSLVTIYDFNSRSGGVSAVGAVPLYRIVLGSHRDWGSSSVAPSFRRWPSIRSALPRTASARTPTRTVPSNSYQGIRRRDEIWMRLRWTF